MAVGPVTHERTSRHSPAIEPIALGDFTASPRMVFIAGIATAIGALSVWVAWAVLRLIALFTNLFYFQRLSKADASPAMHRLGLLSVMVPVVGSLVIGVMARFWFGPYPWPRNS
jgi:hypothetical protein